MNFISAQAHVDLPAPLDTVSYFNFYSDASIENLLALFPALSISNIKLTAITASGNAYCVLASGLVGLTQTPSVPQLCAAPGASLAYLSAESKLAYMSPTPGQLSTTTLRPLSFSADPARLAYARISGKENNVLLVLTYTITVGGPGVDALGISPAFSAPATNTTAPATSSSHSSKI